jgi:hypothetical protein
MLHTLLYYIVGALPPHHVPDFLYDTAGEGAEERFPCRRPAFRGERR